MKQNIKKICFLFYILHVTFLNAFALPEVIATINMNFNEISLRNPFYIAVNPENGYVYIGGSGKVVVWDPLTEKGVGEIKNGYTDMMLDAASDRMYIRGSYYIYIYDLKTLTLLDRIYTGSYIYSMALDSEAKKIYIGCYKKIKVVDIPTKEVKILKSLDFTPKKLCLDKAKKRLYAIGNKWDTTNYRYHSKLITLDLTNNTEISSLDLGGYSYSFDMVLDERKGLVYIANLYGGIKVVDVKENKILSTIYTGSWPYKLAIDSEGEKLYVTDNYGDRFQTIDLVNKKVIATLNPGNDPCGVAFDPIRKKVYTANYWSQDMAIVDTLTNTLIKKIDLSPATPVDIAIDSSEKMAYVVNGMQRKISVVDINKNILADEIKTSWSYGRAITMHSGLKRAFVSDNWGRNIGVYDLKEKKLLNKIFPGGPIQGIDKDEETGKIYAAYNPYYCPLAVIDAKDNKMTDSIPLGTFPMGVAVNPKTKRAYITNYSWYGKLYVVDINTNKIITTINCGYYPHSVAVNPVTNRIYVANQSMSISVIDGNTNTHLGYIPLDYYPYAVEVNPISNRIYVAHYGYVSVINGRDNSLVTKVKVGNYPQNLAVDPETYRVYVPNYYDGTITVIEDISLTDTTPPAITHTPIIDGQPDNYSVKIKAEITDNVGVTEANLYYREKGKTYWYKRRMYNYSGSSYAAYISRYFLVNIRNKEIEYFIDAIDAERNWPPSGNTPGTKKSPNRFKVKDVTPPQPVRNLIAGTTPDENAQVRWIPSYSPDIASYRIYRDNGNGTVDYSRPVAVIIHPGIKWDSSKIDPQKTYKFSVKAVDTANNESIYSPVALAQLSLGPWLNTENLPASRHGYGARISKERIYIIGGGYSPSIYISPIQGVNTVYSAQIKSDGKLETWRNERSLPDIRCYFANAINGDYVYVLGGLRYGYTSTIQRTVWYSKINSDGTLSQWKNATPLPQARFAHTAVVHNGYLYVIGGFHMWWGSHKRTVWYAKIKSDGTLGAWTETISLPSDRFFHGSVVKDGRIYVLGGHRYGVKSDVWFAECKEDGSISSWKRTKSLPGPRASVGSAVTDGNQIFFAGGYIYKPYYNYINSGITEDTVWKTEINADGQLKDWKGVTFLPDSRQAHQILYKNKKIYLPGGMKQNTLTRKIYSNNTVWYADIDHFKKDMEPPKVKISVSPEEVEKGEKITVTVTATDDKDLSTIWWWGISTGDSEIDKNHKYFCSGTSVIHTWQVSIANLSTGTYKLGSNAKDKAYPPRYASEGGGVTYATFTVVDTAPTLLPTLLESAATGTGDSVHISWTPSPSSDLSHYRIWRSTSEDIPGNLIGDNIKLLSFDDNNIIEGKSYRYQLSCVDKVSNESTGTLKVTIIPNIPPGRVEGLKIKIDSGTIKLSYDENTEIDLIGYRIYRSTSAIDFSLLAAVSSIEYSDTDFISGTTYYYYVSAIDEVPNEGENSLTVSVFLNNESKDEVSGEAQAYIKVPKDGKRVRGNAVTVMAKATDKTTGVLFQYKSEGGSVWIDITSIDKKKPYAVYWNTSGLENGKYFLRAVAYDKEGKPDLSTEYINIEIDDVNTDIVEDGNPDVNPNKPHRKWEKFSKEKGEEIIIADGTQAIIPPGINVKAAAIVITIFKQDMISSWLPPVESSLKPVGVFRKYEFSDGSKFFNKEITLIIPYLDEDEDGIVDGTDVKTDSLRLYYLNEETGEWIMVKTTKVHSVQSASRYSSPIFRPAENYITAKVDHFTIFALMGSSHQDDLENVIVYPNPYKPNSELGHTHIYFDGLTENAEVKIYTITGRFVDEITDHIESKRIQWDVLNQDSQKVASGIYLYIVTDGENKPGRGRFAIIR